jgi:hypothetical protein
MNVNFDYYMTAVKYRDFPVKEIPVISLPGSDVTIYVLSDVAKNH